VEREAKFNITVVGFVGNITQSVRRLVSNAKSNVLRSSEAASLLSLVRPFYTLLLVCDSCSCLTSNIMASKAAMAVVVRVLSNSEL